MTGRKIPQAIHNPVRSRLYASDGRYSFVFTGEIRGLVDDNGKPIKVTKHKTHKEYHAIKKK